MGTVAGRINGCPHGSPKDYDDQTRKLLKELGFSCGLTSIAGINDIHADVLELKRYTIDSRLGLAGFIAIVSGLNYYLSWTKNALGNFFRKVYHLLPGQKFRNTWLYKVGR